MHDVNVSAGALEVDTGPSHGGDMTRRRFTQAAMGAVGACYAAALGYPVYRYLATPARRATEAAAVSEVALSLAELPHAGSALVFRFGSRPAMLIHHADGTLACFDAVCTHLGCTVQFQPENDRIFCACHSGEYDPRTGANVAGPPPRPLKAFTVEKTNEQVIITRT
jgi:cytochrome b6-f complex iron-sulfur subunit